MPSPHDALRLERSPGHDNGLRPETCPTDVFRLPALAVCVSEARRRLRSRLGAWGVDTETRDDAGLMLSELFTNALRHSDSALVTCELRIDGSLLRLAVADQGRGPSEPRSREPGADEEGGRGLQLVNALALAWGVQVRPGGLGRLVWAVLPYRRGA